MPQKVRFSDDSTLNDGSSRSHILPHVLMTILIASPRLPDPVLSPDMIFAGSRHASTTGELAATTMTSRSVCSNTEAGHVAENLIA